PDMSANPAIECFVNMIHNLYPRSSVPRMPVRRPCQPGKADVPALSRLGQMSIREPPPENGKWLRLSVCTPARLQSRMSERTKYILMHSLYLPKDLPHADQQPGS